MTEFDDVKKRCKAEGNTPKANSLCAVIKERPDGWYIVRAESADGPYKSIDMALAIVERETVVDEHIC
jgi:hypothetical protein